MSLANRVRNKARRVLLDKTATLRSACRVAVIGCGEIAPDHVSAYRESGHGRVVAVSDISPAALGGALDRWPSVQAFRDYCVMLDEVRPDIVSVCTWPQSHAQIVIDAA